MMNLIGKGLVLIYTVMCVAGLCLALVIYLNFVDWGRAEPRVVHGEVPKQGPPQNELRVASEYDKSAVLYQDAKAARDLTMTQLTPMSEPLAYWHEAQGRLAQNHLYYVDMLEKLRKGEGDIDVIALADVTGTDTPGKPIGKPVPSVKMEGLNKSLATYAAMLKAEQAKLDPIEEDVREWAKKNTEISYQLTGKDATGKRVAPGLFELIDHEFQTQQQHLAERNYWEPHWASAKDEARRYAARRASLEGTLDGLNAALKARKAREK
jgi:hypothetical protein